MSPSWAIDYGVHQPYSQADTITETGTLYPGVMLAVHAQHGRESSFKAENIVFAAQSLQAGGAEAVIIEISDIGGLRCIEANTLALTKPDRTCLAFAHQGHAFV